MEDMPPGFDWWFVAIIAVGILSAILGAAIIFALR
jgi:hypothetical protein